MKRAAACLIFSLCFTTQTAFAEHKANMEHIKSVEAYAREMLQASQGVNILFQVHGHGPFPIAIQVEPYEDRKRVILTFGGLVPLRSKNLQSSIAIGCILICTDKEADGVADSCEIREDSGRYVDAKAFFRLPDLQRAYTNGLSDMHAAINRMRAHGAKARELPLGEGI